MHLQQISSLLSGLATFAYNSKRNKAVLTALAIIAALGLSLAISGICSNWPHITTISTIIVTITSLIILAYLNYRKHSQYIQNQPVLNIINKFTEDPKASENPYIYILSASQEIPIAPFFQKDFLQELISLVLWHSSGIDTLHARGINRNWRNVASLATLWQQKAAQLQLTYSIDDPNHSIRQVIRTERFLRLLDPAGQKYTFENITPKPKKIPLNCALIYSEKLSAIITSYLKEKVIITKTFLSAEATFKISSKRISAKKLFIENYLFQSTERSSTDPYQHLSALYENRLVVISKEGLQLFDSKTGKLIKTITLVHDINVLFDAAKIVMDGQYVAVARDEKNVYGNPPDIDVYEIETGRLLVSISSPRAKIQKILIQNGWLIVSFYDALLWSTIPGTVYVWKLSDLHKNSEPAIIFEDVDFKLWVNYCLGDETPSLQVINNYLIYPTSKSENGVLVLKVWNLKENKPAKTFSIKINASTSSIKPIAFEGDNLLVLIDHQLEVFKIASEKSPLIHKY